MTRAEVIADLIELAHVLAGPPRAYAILGEGNISARVDDASFLVKASGMTLAAATAASFIRVDLSRAVQLMHAPAEVADLSGAVAPLSSDGETMARPSVETGLHAVLLAQAGARWVAHTHPTAVNAVLCSRRAEAIVAGMLFPDQVVVCGPHPLFLPYIDPGIPLAHALSSALDAHVRAYGAPPRAIYLQNHGVVALGQSAAEVLAITDMAVKAASILAMTFACEGPRYLPDDEVRHIAGRDDEQYRQRVLGLREDRAP